MPAQPRVLKPKKIVFKVYEMENVKKGKLGKRATRLDHLTFAIAAANPNDQEENEDSKVTKGRFLDIVNVLIKRIANLPQLKSKVKPLANPRRY
jgi:hypothetical protein